MAPRSMAATAGKFAVASAAAALLFAAPAVRAAHHLDADGHDMHDEEKASGPHPADEHEHGESCACVANEMGFAIDCENTAPVVAALDYLEANCQTEMLVSKSEADEEVCHMNYYILQSHHDFCPHHDLPLEAETKLHLYEDNFEDCEIARQFDEDLEACPPVADCSDSAKLLADIAILDTQCIEDCSSDACAAAFQSVLMAHDTCDEDLLPITLEVALHDFEEVCEDALCNSASEPFSPFCAE
eukprot:PRCOL_00005384-RA